MSFVQDAIAYLPSPQKAIDGTQDAIRRTGSFCFTASGAMFGVWCFSTMAGFAGRAVADLTASVAGGFALPALATAEVTAEGFILAEGASIAPSAVSTALNAARAVVTSPYVFIPVAAIVLVGGGVYLTYRLIEGKRDSAQPMNNPPGQPSTWPAAA